MSAATTQSTIDKFSRLGLADKKIHKGVKFPTSEQMVKLGQQDLSKSELGKQDENADKRLHSSNSHASSGVDSGVTRTGSRNDANPSQDLMSNSSRHDSGDLNMNSSLASSSRISKSTSDDTDENSSRRQSMKVPLEEGFTEDRFRVDRKRLESLLSQSVKIDKNNENSDTTSHLTRAEVFFQEIINTTGCQVSWPSRLKIGAKSKKDPHIKITGLEENVKIAKDRILEQLDSKSSRVTIKMDVSHTNHSHVIGKKGANIKKVMADTECHIHFPDSNRNSFITEKSNQVSIAGQASGVELSRQRIRDLLPILLYFEYPTKNIVNVDINAPQIQSICETYDITCQFKNKKPFHTSIVQVRGSAKNALGIKDGIICLMQLLTGHVGQSMPVKCNIEIQNMTSFMNPKNLAKMKHIQNTTGIHIELPPMDNHRDFNLRRKSSIGTLSMSTVGEETSNKIITMSGLIEGIIYARQEIQSNLPLVLMFDLKQDVSPELAQETGEKYECFISIKSKAKQVTKSCIIKSSEANVYNMFKARQRLMNLPNNGLENIQMPINTASFMLTKMQQTYPQFQQLNPVQLMQLSGNRSPTMEQQSQQKTIRNNINFSPNLRQQQVQAATLSSSQINHGLNNLSTTMGWRNQANVSANPLELAKINSHTPAALEQQKYISKPMLIKTKSTKIPSQNDNPNILKITDPKESRSEENTNISTTSKSEGTNSSEYAARISRQPYPPPSTENIHGRTSVGSSCSDSDHKRDILRTKNFSAQPQRQKKSLEISIASTRKSLLSDKGVEKFSKNHYSSEHDCVSSDISDHEHQKIKISTSAGNNQRDSVISESFFRPSSVKSIRKPPGFSLKPVYTIPNIKADKKERPSGDSSSVRSASLENNPSNSQDSVSVGSSDNSNNNNNPAAAFASLEDLFEYLGMAKYTETFIEQEIDLSTFITMNDSDFRELGVSTFGARRKMTMAVRDLSTKANRRNGQYFGNY